MNARALLARARPDEAALLAERIETVFARIARERMAGLPIVNEMLGVAVRGLVRHGEHWLGVLVTPWFMSLVLLPADGRRDDDAGVGDKRVFALPAGRFGFIRHEEEALGGYWSCALFSPMDEFEDQDAALAAADAAMAAAKEAAEQPGVDELAMGAMWRAAPVEAAKPAPDVDSDAVAPPPPPATLSRRGLFTLGLARDGAQATS